MQIEGFVEIRHIVRIDTNISKSCEHCSEWTGGKEFAKSVNHYLEAHGYKLLHVGQETTHGENGNPWQLTVSLLGK